MLHTVVGYPEELPVTIPPRKITINGAKSLQKNVKCTIESRESHFEGRRLSFSLSFRMFTSLLDDPIVTSLSPDLKIDESNIAYSFSIPLGDIPELDQCIDRILVNELENCIINVDEIDRHYKLTVRIFTCGIWFDSATKLKIPITHKFFNMSEPQAA